MDDLQAFYDQLELSSSSNSKFEPFDPVPVSDYILAQFALVEKKDHVQISELIGSGGQKKVYRAEVSGDRQIAVATVNETGCLWSAEKLCKEAYITKRLSHPHILEVYDYGYDTEFGPYIAMPCVDGETLAEYLKKDLTIHQFIDVLTQTCRALSFAHSRDVFHGDVKAENILVDEQGHVYLIDWGSAHALPCLTENLSLNPLLVCHSHTSFIWGTEGIIPPEIKSSKEISEKTDIYQLGIMIKDILPRFSDCPHKSFLLILASKASLRKPVNRFETVREILLELESLPKFSRKSYPNHWALGISALLAIMFCMSVFVSNLRLDGSVEGQFRIEPEFKLETVYKSKSLLKSGFLLPPDNLFEEEVIQSINESEE